MKGKETVMNRRIPLPFFLAFGLLACAALPASAATTPSTVDDLAWIAGHWQGKKDGDLLDEQWSAPAGGQG
jgi:hypothetical protein